MEQFKQILHQSDLEGKIIKRVIFTDEKCVIHFYHNEFCILKANGYDLHYVELEDSKLGFEINEYSIWHLKNYGFLPESEYKILRAKLDQIKEAQKEADEKRLFERLKSKYDS